MSELHEKYIEEIQTVFEQIGIKRSLGEDHLQFLYWFLWINFKWPTQEDSEPPAEVMDYLCDNGNDQSVDGFYFDADNRFVYAIQSKYSADWSGHKRITYEELKRAADIRAYFSSGSTDSIIFKKANKACRKLLTEAYDKIHGHNYELKTVFASNRLDPTDDNIFKLVELSEGLEIDGNFEIISRYKIIQLWAEFLEGHNPPIPRYFIETIDDRFLRLETPERDLTAFVAVSTAKEIHKLYNKYRERIFEKNVRAFLGNVQVNKEIAATLSKAEIATTIADPVYAFQGADYLFKEMYKDIFHKKNLEIDYVINLHLIASRYAYVFYDDGQSYAAYHVLRFLTDSLNIRKRNAGRLRESLESDDPHRSLAAATKIIYRLCGELIKKLQKQSTEPLSFNTVFGKKSKLMEEMKIIFKSAGFKSQRKRFDSSIAKFIANL
jgi:hypothetical protein